MVGVEQRLRTFRQVWTRDDKVDPQCEVHSNRRKDANRRSTAFLSSCRKRHLQSDPLCLEGVESESLPGRGNTRVRDLRARLGGLPGL